MDSEKNSPLEYQETMNDLGEDIEDMEAQSINHGEAKMSVDIKSGKGDKGGEEVDVADAENVESNADNALYIYSTDSAKNILKENLEDYLKQLDFYKSNPKCKIDPAIYMEGTEEVENYVVKEKILITTYYQYIDMYESSIDVEEDLEREEIVYVEVPKYIIKYNPKVITNYIEKTIEVPSGEEIKRPVYKKLNVPYVVPHVVENETQVVLKKIVQPEIHTSNEEIEVEVQKYVPRLVPVNVYVPRYFGLSAKTTDEVEESVHYADLTQEQTDYLMKELNPHLDDLKKFNEEQLERMNEYIRESAQQAESHDLNPPKPELVSYDLDGSIQTLDYSDFTQFKEICQRELTC
ncbi:conserved Plasmodium protein, unknown function [Plasmodium knowlesi strain H]|uniref:PhIL1 interacting protein PIP2 n=3 Tax=Plasmodium knowlesi TaxID=5850 RepID=A0A5K1UBB7_PLAKH|nr:PhIL1 interacting protein PIP2, putative [Plasmodium knowlesi strain H]OTN67671.1 Uncharacterized protein PKNOH_S05372200 [Plasmodium knowlesi]CAA9990312.1 PhIL1 interacting protein PIP2, putative [Plasmodium knowlesi strain H]SBO19518.1 conserved Plasmodium protein, unknown function [Plasmodium knowlesi strain H]SBO22801.1 conserved Plasmodium protein, unknown function [Plasmodium knowlesi strain H]VVS79786.1 PhIL1 interacting protein PIP2, putative [Plasmodium knowlesi strain H]|eukprot:XP_002260712.1 hypothetical protein, conserved in Plasmodium species [Plasmodium knowlesi strain H]